MNQPLITEVSVGRRRTGGTGIFAYDASVTYNDGNTHHTTFTSSTYGGDTPWVSAGSVFIDGAVRERCGGKLTPAFIRAFYDVEA